MSDAVARIAWRRSFYWRIAGGFVLCLVGVLAAQAVAILWLVEADLGGADARQSMQAVAGDLGVALAANPDIDIPLYLNRRYPQSNQPLIVIMNDGQVFPMDAMPRPFPGDGRGWPMDRPTPGVPKPPPWPRVPPAGAFAEISVSGHTTGVVVASPKSRLTTLAWASGGVGAFLVVAGTALAAWLVFWPIRRRMQEFDHAARAIGEGDGAVHVPERGKDEWTALARTFNRMAADLDRRKAELQTNERMRRALLADVSHELRTPLTTMRGYLETLAASAENFEGATGRQYIEIVQEETLRLEHIVGDLLDLAKLEASGDHMDIQDIPVEGLFGQIAARSALDLTRQGTRLSTSIAPGAEIVVGDALRIEQALQNLIWNAIRHTPPGGRIELVAEPSAIGVDLIVRDTGSGIPDDHLPFVFERFYKVDPARSHESTGSGLGLSIVKAIVERHGGSVSVQSKLTCGTTFSIHLPDPHTTPGRRPVPSDTLGHSS